MGPRVSADEEEIGLDLTQHGQRGYIMGEGELIGKKTVPLVSSTGAEKAHMLVPERPFQPSPHVPWNGWPGSGTVWNSQSFLPVRTSKARGLPDTPTGFSVVAAPMIATSPVMVGDKILAISEKADSSRVRAFLTQLPPLSAKGKFALARALLAQGDRKGAETLVRETWRYDGFSADVPTAAAAASAAASPSSRCRRITRTRSRSAREYRRRPPGERTGSRRPYRRSQARSSSGLTPERRLSSPIRRREVSGMAKIYRSWTNP